MVLQPDGGPNTPPVLINTSILFDANDTNSVVRYGKGVDTSP